MPPETEEVLRLRARVRELETALAAAESQDASPHRQFPMRRATDQQGITPATPAITFADTHEQLPLPVVLLVDDAIEIQRLVTAQLTKQRFVVHGEMDGLKGLQAAIDLRPDVILLDIDLPNMDGMEICQRLKDHDDTRLIPVVFLTGRASLRDKIRGLELGALDYVIKPFDAAELIARVRSAFHIKRLLTLLEQRAQLDGLTSLYNRAFFERRIREELHRTQRYGGILSIVMIDIDHFKGINDRYGHLTGDKVLSEIANQIQEQSRPSDLVARYGGEEIAVLLPEQTSRGALAFAERVRRQIEKTEIRTKSSQVNVTASFGIACSEWVGSPSPDRLVDAADKALYHAKDAGRNCVMIWHGSGICSASQLNEIKS